MRTWLTEAFNLAVPVVSAPMAGVAGGQLASAVSLAGSSPPRSRGLALLG